ncbi:hypothetical protein DSUL_60052 [Desulfovibrionales bacterium]
MRFIDRQGLTWMTLVKTSEFGFLSASIFVVEMLVVEAGRQ